MEPAVSVRLCLKTHEIQTEVHHESNSSLKVCPVVIEDEMDEDIMDDTEEQLEESRAVRVGQKKTVTPTLAEREEHERTHIRIEVGADTVSLHGQAILLIEAESFTKAVEDDKGLQQVSYDYNFKRDKLGMESATILVSER